MITPNDMDELLPYSKLKPSDAISGDGLGAMPINRDIDYFGFTKMSNPYRFLKLCTERTYDKEGIKYLMDFIKNGGKVGPPTLFVEWLKDEKLWMVTGHEGRGRATAIENLYIRGFFIDNKMPVHIIPSRMRSRDMNEEKLNANFIGEVFCNTYEYPKDKRKITIYVDTL